MPKSWSKKDERQYEHIKDSSKKRGRSTKRAKEIAARTVNKTRSSEGRTKQQKNGSSSGSSGSSRSSSGSRRSSSSSGSSSSRSRSSSSGSGRSSGGPTKKELYERAKKQNIEGRSKMSKQQLQRAVS